MGYTIWPDGEIGSVLQDVYRECNRQYQLQTDGKFPWTCAQTTNPDTGKAIPQAEKLVVLAEEFGEVADIVCKLQANRGEAQKVSLHKLREELVQVAAVAASWAESLAGA